ncbi:vWA domain-containing protein [Fibrella aquatilis]|uniref:VWA domain-containing protein n=1 Tax=Fibrella aquatilis TaxID=2817059 RepID=A0A939G3M0_9BACT|nr:VWA domain-containing protein [Fibrella aquatilis]MBO0931261.1 VWA domain-containing protein [Fibrella aquatilis]
MITRRTSLSHNIVAFCRFLRANGMGIGPDEEASALLALATIRLGDRDEFRLALRTVLCRRASDLEAFDTLFAQYWKELEKAVDAKRKDDPKQKQRTQPKQGPDFNQLKSWLYGNKPTEETSLVTYSTQQNLAQQDFATISADDLQAVMQYIRELSLTLARQANRRHQKTASARRFDLPRTLRKNLRRGGELIDLAYQKPRKNRLNVVILADVSQSMDLYSTFLIQFMYAFQSVYRRIDTFVFSTELHRISSALKSRPFTDALQHVAETAPGWGGGTRIGASLEQFVDEHLSLVNNHTLVLILSDGWDTDDPQRLTDSLRRIKTKAKKLVWLNPLAGSPTFEPTTAAMQAALPLLDGFAAVHNVASLRALGRWL